LDLVLTFFPFTGLVLPPAKALFAQRAVKALHERLFILAIWSGHPVTLSVAANPLFKLTHELLAPIGLQYLTRPEIGHHQLQRLPSILTS
jgi:hypothetical protein